MMRTRIMTAMRSILVVVDPEHPNSPAVDKAGRLARAFDASVELLLCDMQPDYAPQVPVSAETLALFTERVQALHQSTLDRLAGSLRATGITVSACVKFGRPLDVAIIGHIRDVEPDLVLKDTHHHSVLRRTLLSNTDWQLLRACPVPLMLVKRRLWAAEPRIVAAVDCGHPGDRPDYLTHAIVDAGVLLARAMGSRVELLHAWPAIPLQAQTAAMAGGAAMMSPPELIEALQKANQEALDHLARVHDVPGLQVHWMQGTPVEVLTLFADRRAVDVLLIGVISRSALDHLFIGSTAERVLEHVACDVLAINAQLPADRRAVIP